MELKEALKASAAECARLRAETQRERRIAKGWERQAEANRAEADRWKWAHEEAVKRAAERESMRIEELRDERVAELTKRCERAERELTYRLKQREEIEEAAKKLGELLDLQNGWQEM